MIPLHYMRSDEDCKTGIDSQGLASLTNRILPIGSWQFANRAAPMTGWPRADRPLFLVATPQATVWGFEHLVFAGRRHCHASLER